jgi:hypothetical protein
LENREAKLREALGQILIDTRQTVMSSVRHGFTLGGKLVSVQRALVNFTFEERSRLVSGVECLSSEAFVALLDPVFPQEELFLGASDRSLSRNQSLSGGASSSTGSSRVHPNYRSAFDLLALEHNFALLESVLRSEDFVGHLTNLLRFITGSPSILDTTMRVQVHFSLEAAPTSVPTSHTCFQCLYLSAHRYESQAHLAKLLAICAQNSTAFGKR